MPLQRLEQVRSILAAALQLPLEQRANFVRDQSLEDRALQAEVEDLLGVFEAAGEFLNTPLPELLGAKIRTRKELPVGAVLKGRYRLEKLLDESGFASVYLAKDEPLADKLVVIKILDQIHDEQTIQNAFRSELQSLSQLHHPNVVGVSDAGSLDDGTPFLVLAYIPGSTLREVLRGESLSLGRARRIIQGIGQALSAAHKVGVWHLDVKPENVILSEAGTTDERITVIDFGIARLKGLPGGSLTAGSLAYMAPEQREEPTAKSDLYSLALVAVELFTGRLPDPKQAVEKQLPHSVGVRAIRAITRALDPEPSKRFNTVSEFMEEVCSVPTASRWRGYGLVAAGLLVVAAAIFLSSRRVSDGPYYSKPLPFVTTPGPEYRPSFSPDGKWLFYAEGPLEHMDIYKKETGGGEPVRVVDNPAGEDQPQVSPDGKTLAFIRIFQSECAVLLKTLDSAGIETELGRALEFSTLSWAADGNALAVSQGHGQAGGTKLRSVNIRSRMWKDLIPPDPRALADDNPTVSPDGRKIAFVRKWTQESADLFVVDVDRSLQPQAAARQITNRRERIDSLQWTPDGRELVYLAGPLGNGSLWRIPAGGGKPSSLLPHLSRFESIAIPRDVWKIAYSVHLSDSNIWRFELDQNGPGAFKQVIAGTYDDEEARLSPDGRRIAFVSGRSGEEQIWVAGADGKSPRQITSFAAPDSMEVMWTRDSKELIISVRSKELGERFYRTPATGPPALTELMQQANATDLSQDGRWLYMRRRLGNERQIWRTDYPEMKTLERIVAGEARVAYASPDGRSLYFTKRTEREGVWKQTLPDGRATRVIDQIYRRNLFAPGRDGLFYIARVPGSAESSALFFRSDKDGKSTRLHTFDVEVFWGLDLSLDERSLLVSQLDIGNVDIMLVESFR